MRINENNSVELDIEKKYKGIFNYIENGEYGVAMHKLNDKFKSDNVLSFSDLDKLENYFCCSESIDYCCDNCGNEISCCYGSGLICCGICCVTYCVNGDFTTGCDWLLDCIGCDFNDCCKGDC